MTEMIDQLKEQIKRVANSRAKAAAAREARHQSFAKWESENDAILDNEKIANEIVTAEEIELRKLTLAIFNATQDKHPDPNVGIREVDKLVYDPVLALNYAKEHGVALKLDTASFEKMAKIDELRPGFVTIEKVATATIATEIKIIEEKK